MLKTHICLCISDKTWWRNVFMISTFLIGWIVAKKKFVNSSSSCEIWSKVHRNICFVFSDIFYSVDQVSDIKTKRQMHKTHIRFWWNGVRIKNRQTDESNFKSDDNTKKHQRALWQWCLESLADENLNKTVVSGIRSSRIQKCATIRISRGCYLKICFIFEILGLMLF